MAVLDSTSKSFGAVHAVVELSLSVAGGEIYGLLGPNGAGKTTALRMLAGLLAPTAGRALLAGRDAKTTEAKRHLGYLSGSTGLFGRLTGREVLDYFGQIHGMARARIRERLRGLAQALALEAVLDRRCEVLSTGERQRVSIARAVLHDPAVLILDEPTSGLDVLASRFLRDFVRGERQRGKAVVFSTHYLAEAELLCDRVGFLHHGRLLSQGTPAEVRGGAGTLEEAFLALADRDKGGA
ncbi:MAG: ABC transporter ATP-binding protein [Deltaproteobacteria bacterium]|nr:ABC transporter ATP-binding protein [Deltaproteobacteria bacterium]